MYSGIAVDSINLEQKWLRDQITPQLCSIDPESFFRAQMCQYGGPNMA